MYYDENGKFNGDALIGRSASYDSVYPNADESY